MYYSVKSDGHILLDPNWLLDKLIVELLDEQGEITWSKGNAYLEARSGNAVREIFNYLAEMITDRIYDLGGLIADSVDTARDQAHIEFLESIDDD